MKSVEQLESEARQYMSKGDFQNSIHTLNQGLGIAQSSNPRDLALIARLFNNLGFAHRELRDLQTAEKYFQQSLQVERQIGDPDNPEMAITLQHLGRLAHYRRDYETSWKLWTEALEMLNFFIEPIPVFRGWPDAPCVYVLFSAPYKKTAIQAREVGWKTYELDAGHFHMLVDAPAVTDIIIKAVDELI